MPPASEPRAVPLFDTYAMLDWSAEGAPKTGANSIWLAVGRRTRAGLALGAPENLPTRAAAREAVGRLLQGEVQAGRRTLLGVDFPLGYPAGLAAALGLAGPAWRATWEVLGALITDGPTNRNNRFAVAAQLNARTYGEAFPFWGCPAAAVAPTLSPRRPREGWGQPRVAEFRVAEAHARGASSPWKLAYPGSVGGQALVGIPVARAWRGDPALAAHLRVWPFETGLRALGPDDVPPGRVVLAEVYPSLLRLAGNPALVRDARQVQTLVQAFATRDAAGTLGGRFAGPPGLTATQAEAITAEEGLILQP
ncbi:MAG: cobalamin biosynthesis protein CbiG [Candidatus Sericytochromatia bacterium]|nr:cobalamin biosynthesis protein CbiG [Candidatus Sericytochromatia bacterium]